MTKAQERKERRDKRQADKLGITYQEYLYRAAIDSLCVIKYTLGRLTTRMRFLTIVCGYSKSDKEYQEILEDYRDVNSEKYAIVSQFAIKSYEVKRINGLTKIQ